MLLLLQSVVCPPDNFTPRSPIIASKPSGISSMNSKTYALQAFIIVHRGFWLAYAMLFFIVSLNNITPGLRFHTIKC